MTFQQEIHIIDNFEREVFDLCLKLILFDFVRNLNKGRKQNLGELLALATLPIMSRKSIPNLNSIGFQNVTICEWCPRKDFDGWTSPENPDHPPALW